MVNIRVATEGDAESLLAIYAPYVTETAITFEYEIPSVEEFRSRINNTLQKYPYIVAEREGMIIGYAYVSPFHGRPAYDWAVETSIYLDKKARKSGAGRPLHDALEKILQAMHITNMEACIGVPSCDEDPYLDRNSQHFHDHIGYRLVGEFEKCGYKFGRWYDMIWMEKIIGEHQDKQPAVIWFKDHEKELMDHIRS